jgi:hypothetical protein
MLVNIVGFVSLFVWLIGLAVGAILLVIYWPLIFALDWLFILEVGIGVFAGLCVFACLCLGFMALNAISEMN